MVNLESKLNEAIDAATRKDFDLALKICNQVMQEDGKLAEVFRTRSQVYRLMGDVGKSIDDRTEAIRIGAQSVDYFFRGWWYLDDGDLELALVDLSKAITLEKSSDAKASTESAFFFRALTLLRLGRFDEALADCTKVRDEFVIHVRGLGRLSKDELIACAKERKSDPRERQSPDGEIT